MTRNLTEPPTDAPRAAPEERIRAVGERVTTPRVAVLQALMEAENPLTHHEIMTRMGRYLPHMDRVTLYRVLDWLVAHKLAHKVSAEDRVWRFRIAGEDEPHAHPHFHCDQCGKVFCLDDVRVPSPATPVGYRAREVEILIHGRCPACP